MTELPKRIESKYWLDERGVLRIRIDAETDVHITLSDAKHYVQECVTLSNGLPRLLLIDVRSVFGSISKDALEFLKTSTELNALRKAEGFIASTLATHLFIRVTFSYPSVAYPCKIFSNEERAWQWLKDFQ